MSKFFDVLANASLGGLLALCGGVFEPRVVQRIVQGVSRVDG